VLEQVPGVGAQTFEGLAPLPRPEADLADLVENLLEVKRHRTFARILQAKR
jgi:hypothetical protein